MATSWLWFHVLSMPENQNSNFWSRVTIRSYACAAQNVRRYMSEKAKGPLKDHVDSQHMAVFGHNLPGRHRQIQNCCDRFRSQHPQSIKLARSAFRPSHFWRRKNRWCQAVKKVLTGYQRRTESQKRSNYASEPGLGIIANDEKYLAIYRKAACLEWLWQTAV